MAEQPERLDLRLSPEHKRLIERAATVKGHTSVSGFAAVQLVEAARAILEEHEVLSLSSRDWDRFAEILDQNEPNEALASAARHYRTKHSR